MTKRITVFGSSHWPTCEPLKEYLSKNKIKYHYIDITESMGNLKIFLKFRDTQLFFQEAKKKGSVGIPTIMINRAEEFINGDDDFDLDRLR